MKVTYLGYLRILKKFPGKIPALKVIPGDSVDVPDSFINEMEKDEVVVFEKLEEKVEEVCESCKKIVKRCICAKLERDKVARKIALQDDEEVEEEKKEEVISITVDQGKVDKILNKKRELKSSNMNKLEQRKALEDFKKDLEEVKVEEPKAEEVKVEEPKAALKKGKIKKDPKTGEFYTAE